jgi:hypothetical protein
MQESTVLVIYIFKYFKFSNNIKFIEKKNYLIKPKQAAWKGCQN